MPPERPSEEERAWLLARLADLVDEAGFERLVGSALVEVNDAWFPDRWSESAGGVRVLLRRLFAHAGLPGMSFEVEDLRGHAPAESGIPASEVHYAGYEGGRVVFELYRIGRDDLVGILCHEVGAACLDVMGIGRGPRGPFRDGAPAAEMGPARQALASMATVYLGLGVPATNAAHRVQARSELVGGAVVSQWLTTTAGGLSAQSLAYLLAVQRVVRDRSTAAYDALLTNQRADFDDWCEELADSREELVAALRLPAESTWPSVPSSLSLVPFTDPDDEQLPAIKGQFNRGQAIYRVRGNQLVRGGGAGLLLGAVVAVVLRSIIGPVGMVALAVLTLVGLIVGRSFRRDVCSDPRCEQRLPPGAETCPYCAGTIAGELKHADERLDQEEEAG